MKQSGGRLQFRYGGDAVSTRMYRTLRRCGRAGRKILRFCFRVRDCLLRIMEFLLILGAGVTGIVGLLRGHFGAGMVAAILAATLLCLFIRRIRKAHFPWDANLLSLLGLPLFSYLLLRSWLSYKRGNVNWKGRTYDTGPTRREAKALVRPVEDARREVLAANTWPERANEWFI